MVGTLSIIVAGGVALKLWGLQLKLGSKIRGNLLKTVAHIWHFIACRKGEIYRWVSSMSLKPVICSTFSKLMQRKKTDSQLWWCIVSAFSHDRCLDGSNSFIINGRKAARLAGNDSYVYDGLLLDCDHLLLVILLVYLVVKPLSRCRIKVAKSTE